MAMRFLIMNGAGNRFAVFDARTSDSFALNPEKVAAICKPGSSVMGELGADQLIVMRAPKDSAADVFMEIWNQKGFEVDACGNATRCVGWLVMTESGAQACTVQTNDALLHCTLAGTHQVAVDMGKPKLDWEQIPLEEVMHTHHVDVKIGPMACGTGACAAVVAAVRQSRGSRRMRVEVDGGMLLIDWRLKDDHVIMTGPVELEMDGAL